MSALDKAMLWELPNVERNPMDLVDVGISKRKKRPRVLQVKDAWQILEVLVQPLPMRAERLPGTRRHLGRMCWQIMLR